MSEVDEMWLQAVAEDLAEMGCDETFIECTIEDLRDGESVQIFHDGRAKTYRPG